MGFLGREVEDVHRRVEDDVRGREEEEEKDAFGRAVSLEAVVEGVCARAAEVVSEVAVERSHNTATDSVEGLVDAEEVALVGEFGLAEGTKVVAEADAHEKVAEFAKGVEAAAVEEVEGETPAAATVRTAEENHTEEAEEESRKYKVDSHKRLCYC